MLKPMPADLDSEGKLVKAGEDEVVLLVRDRLLFPASVSGLFNRFAHSAGPGMVRHRVEWIGSGVDSVMQSS